MFKIRVGMFAAIGAALLLFSPAAKAATYTFTGVCGPNDCTGTGVGTLVLSGYTEGALLHESDFVSFDYSSSLISFSVDNSNLSSIDGFLGPNFPASYRVRIFTNDNKQFSSDTTGDWAVFDFGQNTDFGSTSSWNNAAAVVTPIPGALPLFVSGLAGLGWLAHRRRRKATA